MEAMEALKPHQFDGQHEEHVGNCYLPMAIKYGNSHNSHAPCVDALAVKPKTPKKLLHGSFSKCPKLSVSLLKIENDQSRGSLKNMFPSTRAWGESRRTDLHFCDVDTHAVFATSCPVRELNGESAVEKPKFSEEFIYRYIGPIPRLVH